MTAAIRQMLLLAGLALSGFAVFVLLFWAGVGAEITIIFYRGVVLATAVALLTGLIGLWLARRINDCSLPIAAAALSFSLNVCFLVLLPVTVDRSVTVYLLATIERHQSSGIDPKDLQQAFVDGYVVKMGAIDRRIDEQRKSGNIRMGADQKVELTMQGRRFMAVCRLVSVLFGTDRRFVEGSVDSLANSRNVAKHN